MFGIFHPGKNETAGGCCGPPPLLHLVRMFDFPPVFPQHLVPGPPGGVCCVAGVQQGVYGESVQAAAIGSGGADTAIVQADGHMCANQAAAGAFRVPVAGCLHLFTPAGCYDACDGLCDGLPFCRVRDAGCTFYGPRDGLPFVLGQVP